ncbi:MAG: GTP-binding protein [Candidatus Hodarchaeota archaeon]
MFSHIVTSRICKWRIFPTILLKIVLAGDGAVGKTSLRERYLGRGFKSNYLATIGADFAIADRTIEGKEIKFQIWDLAGQPQFSAVRGVYYANCLGALQVFDVTRPDSLTNLNSWIHEFWNNNGRGAMPFIILGNKTDLRDQFPHSIPQKKVDSFVEEWNDKTQGKGFQVTYLDTSAKTGLNVDIAFELLGKAVLDYIESQ